MSEQRTGLIVKSSTAELFSLIPGYNLASESIGCGPLQIAEGTKDNISVITALSSDQKYNLKDVSLIQSVLQQSGIECESFQYTEDFINQPGSDKLAAIAKAQEIEWMAK